MAATAQKGRHTDHFIFTSLVALCVLCNGGTALSTSMQATDTSPYLSTVYPSSKGVTDVPSSVIQSAESSSTIISSVIETSSVTSSTSDSSSGSILTDVSSSVIQSAESSSTTIVSLVETSSVTFSSLDSSSSLILTTPSTIVKTSVTLITSPTFNYTAISPTVVHLTSDTLINGTDVTSYLFSTSYIDISSTAGIDLYTNTTSKHSQTTMDQASSSIVSTHLNSDISSAIRPSTTYLAIGSSLYTETPTVTADLILSSSRSFGDTTSVSFIVTSTSSTAAMTDSSLQPSTTMRSISSAVTEVTTALTNTTTGGTLTSTLTPSSLSPSTSPELNSSSGGLLTTATTHANTPVYTPTQHATTTTTAFLKTSSSEVSHSELVTSSYHVSSSSSSVVIAPTSSSDVGVTSSTMSVTPDPALLAELDSLRSKVQELEDSNSGLQTATIVLALIVALIILAIIGLYFLRRRRMAKRKKNRFAGIDADLTTPVIQRPKPAFGYSDSKDMAFGGRISTATLEDSGEMSTLGTFSTLPKSGVHNNNMDTPS